MFETRRSEGVLQVRRPGTRWLSTGWNGGFERAPAAYNLAVPAGWDRTELDTYVRDRCTHAGFEGVGPSLLTGVDMDHARGARIDPVVAFATVGLSNPAALATDPSDTGTVKPATDPPSDGTVNLLVGTTRALSDASLATLLGVVVEAKTATLLSETGFPGTTTDAVIVGSDPDGEAARFAGSATAVGGAARACVRDAVRASLQSRYTRESVPRSVEEAEHGLVTDRPAEVFDP